MRRTGFEARNVGGNWCDEWEYTPPEEREATRIAYLQRRVADSYVNRAYLYNQIENDLTTLRSLGVNL